MRPLGKRCAVLFLLAASAVFCHLAMANTLGPDFDARVQTAAEEVMEQYGIPGLAIALTRNGKQRFYSYGVASKDTQQPVSRDTLFELGSISKTFTVTLATHAQAKGLLSLGDSPGTYLPSLRGSALDRVTLINLGTHTAGGFPLQVPEAIGNTQQLLDYFKAWQPTYAPGSHRTYANPSIGLLGMIAAKALNLPFDAALEQQLFAELGMPDSHIQVPASKLPRYAQGYNKEDAPVRLNPGVLAAEAYGVKSSAKDLIRFIEANLGRTETGPTLARALADTRRGYFQIGAMTQDLIWEQYSYPVTLATLLEGNANRMVFESMAATPLNPPLPPQDAVWVNKTGSTNGFSAYLAFVPAKQLGIVLLANKNHPSEARVRLAHRILSELDCCAQAEH